MKRKRSKVSTKMEMSPLSNYSSGLPSQQCRYSPKQWMNYLTNLTYTYGPSTTPGWLFCKSDFVKRKKNISIILLGNIFHIGGRLLEGGKDLLWWPFLGRISPWWRLESPWVALMRRVWAPWGSDSWVWWHYRRRSWLLGCGAWRGNSPPTPGGKCRYCYCHGEVAVHQPLVGNAFIVTAWRGSSPPAPGGKCRYCHCMAR